MQYKVFTPTEYIEVLNGGLSGYSAVLEGEISEYKVSQGKWIFFKVKDESSVLDCFSTVFQLKTPLEDGMQVRLYGTPKIHAKSGRFSLNVAWVEASGEGSLKRAFEILKIELEKEGFFAKERKRSIPKFPQKIGLIASKESAAYKDFIKILSERFSGVEIFLYDVSVQGENSVNEIVSAFSYFNLNREKLNLDLIVLTRGGGSLEDLKSFNSREVTQAIFTSVFPVVCGVGHEQDTSLADYVSDIRASTPSNVAEIISPHREDVLIDIENKIEKAELYFKNIISQFDIKYKKHKIERSFYDILNIKKTKIIGNINSLENFLYGKIRNFYELQNLFLNSLKIFEQELIIKKLNIKNKLKILESLSPKSILKKGYSIVTLNNKVISSIKSIKKEVVINILLSDGSFDSKIININKNKKNEKEF